MGLSDLCLLNETFEFPCFISKNRALAVSLNGAYGRIILNSALLWDQLMGKGVLSADIDSPFPLRSYAHCSKGRVSPQSIPSKDKFI